VHFAEPPDQPLVRELVTNAAGADIAEGIAFDTVEAKDWVKASLEDLVPVPAGRFVVHGQHDRDRIASNKIGIEIEAALAFGTGHHGTTRGCLLLLDHVLKAWRPRRVLDLGTGTGVLAIAAAKALHQKVLASDIDPPSAQVILPGLLTHQAPGVIAAYRARGLVPVRHLRIEGWSSLLLRKVN
jgi:ribosomal protein L11 methyltransferase